MDILLLILFFIIAIFILVKRLSKKTEKQTYDNFGKDDKGRYNRMYDKERYAAEGFLDPRSYPVALTDHARERMRERMGIKSGRRMEELVLESYSYGKSARQVRKTAAAKMYDIENRGDNGIVLLYRDYIYIFSPENVLITVYENDCI
ncbi:MAG: hypothetical protein IJZ63_04145 [Clostridia bacterium]|nr:hypothetical protein [Clostridia bacterium]